MDGGSREQPLLDEVLVHRGGVHASHMEDLGNPPAAKPPAVRGAVAMSDKLRMMRWSRRGVAARAGAQRVRGGC